MMEKIYLEKYLKNILLLLLESTLEAIQLLLRTFFYLL